MIEEVYKKIFRIEVTLPDSPLKTLNAYLIKGNNGDYLIDTGYRVKECVQCLDSSLDELKCDRERLNVILTHMHSDHSGLVDVVCGKNGHVYLSETDHAYGKKYIDGILRKLTIERMLESGIRECEILSDDSQEAQAGDFFDSRFVDLCDGDKINTGEYILQAIHTPGHTPGHMTYYIEDRKIMFTGDNVLYTITPNITVFPFVKDSLKDYLNTLERLKNIDVDYAFPAHRNINGDYYSRISELIHHHKKRFSEVYRIVLHCPGITPYDIASQMKWNIRHNDWSDFPITQKWFALGECNAHLDYLQGRGCIGFEIKDGIRRYSVTGPLY